jgi:hypothetical protein
MDGSDLLQTTLYIWFERFLLILINDIVGNSKFYGVIVPVEEIFASIFKARGFVDINVRPIRKRTSRKELYKYLVSARTP